MSWIQKIRDAIDYIEANLSGDITADTVGRAISYSPSSFQNIFSAVTGYSIGEYVRFRRLSRAAEKGSNENKSVEIPAGAGISTL